MKPIPLFGDVPAATLATLVSSYNKTLSTGFPVFLNDIVVLLSADDGKPGDSGSPYLVVSLDQKTGELIEIGAIAVYSGPGPIAMRFTREGWEHMLAAMDKKASNFVVGHRADSQAMTEVRAWIESELEESVNLNSSPLMALLLLPLMMAVSTSELTLMRGMARNYRVYRLRNSSAESILNGILSRSVSSLKKWRFSLIRISASTQWVNAAISASAALRFMEAYFAPSSYGMNRSSSNEARGLEKL